MEKVGLPIKTKIAAWWIITIGIFGLIICTLNIKAVFDFLFPFSSLVFFLLPGFFLLERKRWAWWLAIIGMFFIFSKYFLLGIGIPFMEPLGMILFTLSQGKFCYTPAHPNPFLFLIFLIPLTLLLLDRKNFWKIAT